MFEPHKSFILPSAEKVYVIGDIHGDLNATLDILIDKIKVLNKKKNNGLEEKRLLYN